MTITQSPARLLLARQAAALRDAGLTYDQIASRLSVSPHQVRRLIRDGQAQRLTTWMDRRFGVEIEHTGSSPRSVAAEMRALGLDAEAQDYNHRVQPVWKVVNDGSCGWEAVSPILSGAAGFGQIVAAMTAIKTQGGSVNRQCGLHVHFDMGDLDGPAIARFVSLYAGAQEAINGLVPPSRRHNGYCRPWAADELRRATGELESMRSIGAYYDRYRTINVMSFPRYGTIEVRQHQGTLNPAKIEGWIKLMMALVEIAKTDRCGEVVTDQGPVAFVESVASIVGMPDVIKRRLVRRAEQTSAMV